eukprot:3585226-Rhodomonas_salina.1
MGQKRTGTGQKRTGTAKSVPSDEQLVEALVPKRTTRAPVPARGGRKRTRGSFHLRTRVVVRRLGAVPRARMVRQAPWYCTTPPM